MFEDVVHAVPNWVLVILAVLGALCILSSAALALAVAGLNAIARRRDTARRRTTHLQVVPNRDRIVQARPRAGQQEPATPAVRDPERVAPP